MLHPLNIASIYETINPAIHPLISDLVIFDSIDSTNEYILNQQQARSGFICLAEQQQNGRGRRGRSWQSPAGSNIYLSLLWEFPPNCKNIASLSLAVGIAVVLALHSHNFAMIKLKWPNDLVVKNADTLQKLGGILIETQANRVVIGIGINVNMPALATQQIEQAWTDLSTIAATADKHHAIDRNHLIGIILNYILPLLKNYETQSSTYLEQHWKTLDALLDCDVAIMAQNTMIAGKAKGINHLGGLLVQTHDGATQCFYSGEVSVRLNGSLD